jgi:Na+-transporting NADH:ubiquinone oxidoreductase subunit C
VPAEGNGYADVIKLMVGLTAEADELTGAAVLANNETPGLGNLIKNQSFLRQFAGKPSYVQIEAVQGVDDPANLGRDEIAALSGATISSQSVADIIFNELTANGLVYELHGLCLEARGQSATRPSTQGGDDAQ